MTAYTFINLLEKKGFIVIDNLEKDQETLLPERKIENLGAMHIPVESYTAVDTDLKTEFLYEVFQSPDDAMLLVNLYKKNKTVNVTDIQKVGGYNVQNAGNSYSNRNGVNYERTFIRDFEDRYFLISRIENTLLIGSIHNDDAVVANIFFGETGY